MHVFSCQISNVWSSAFRRSAKAGTPNNRFSGDFVGRVTPVPIPNTEVKPTGADDTASFRCGKVGSRRIYFTKSLFRNEQAFCCTSRPGKSRHLKQTPSHRENAHHAAVLVHDIVEKLTAYGSLVDRCWPSPAGILMVRTGSDSDRVLRKKMFALFALIAGW